jgi:phospholipase C
MVAVKRWVQIVGVVALGVLVAACARGSGRGSAGSTDGSGRAAPDAVEAASKIRHVIVIMQENRSFDSYFGTYPGADGIPASAGHFSVCVPDPAHGHCVPPYHDAADRNGGGPHSASNATADVAGGRMDGFVGQAEQGPRGCGGTNAPECSPHTPPDVLGYHDAREIPNYWTYAHQFVLQDHMFEPNASWSLPQHLFLVSEWSARCRTLDPMSCANALESPAMPMDFGARRPPNYAWTDITYLLHRAGVSWRYYVQRGVEPDCRNDAADCPPVRQDARTPGIWNPLPNFETVRQDHQLANVSDVSATRSSARRARRHAPTREPVG